MLANIDDVCDYLIIRMCNSQPSVNLLKIQKLLYYSQAWHYAIYEKPLFLGDFQAWTYGPMSPDIFNRFKDTKLIYSSVGRFDIRPGFDYKVLTKNQRSHIEEVLENYGEFSGMQLQSLTNKEYPWNYARKGYRNSEKCRIVILPTNMIEYYKNLTNN